MPIAAARHRYDGSLLVDGATCRYTLWSGPRDDLGADVVVVHGAAANRHWWSHVAPMIDGARVIVVDLFGHGDSASRTSYTLDDWARQVTETARRLRSRRPYVVGHSLGGLVAVHAAQTDPGAVGAVLALDTVLRRTDEAVLARRRRTAEGPPRTYPTLHSAVAEFVRRHPAAAVADEGLLVEIATRSHRRVGDSWQRTFDPRVFGRPEVSEDFLHPAPVPTMWARAERGNIDDPMSAEIRSRLGTNGVVVDVPEVGHQLNLEQPQTCGSLINAFRAWVLTAPVAPSTRPARPLGTRT